MKGRCDLHSERTRKDDGVKFKILPRCAVSDVIPDVIPFSVGALQGVCQHYSALYFKAEKNTAGHFTLCCYDGKIKLPPITILEEMKELFTGTDTRAKNFRENIDSIIMHRRLFHLVQR